ncbi:head decoration protein [Pontibacterium sp.]|uniref:head decoration protein n=1 Tax=Pontibacterium sp. TaxID=2036026 RepID=UPI00356AE696
MSHNSPQRMSAHLKSELSPDLSRESVVVEGGFFPSGAVLGLLDNGNYTFLDLAVDATEAHEAKLIVFGSVDATDAPMPAVGHVRLAAVYSEFLTFPDAATDVQKQAFLDQLAADYVIAR